MNQPIKRGRERVSRWNGWRVLALYRKPVGWLMLGGAAAAAYRFGWIDIPFVREVASGAAEVLRAMMPGVTG